MADHRTLISSEVHEPKWISDAVTADAGKVITPSSTSNATSELRVLTPAEVGVYQYYGEMALDANTTAFSVTAASDPTLYTTTDYVDLNSVRLSTIYLDENSGVSFDSVNNALVVSTSGIWRVGFWLNVTSSINSTKVGVKSKVNSTFANFTAKTDLANSGRVNILSGSFLKQMTAGDKVSLALASSTTADITVQDIRMHLELVG